MAKNNQRCVAFTLFYGYNDSKGGLAMDQMKIGKFIAERRKSVNLTQMQLAEKLNITDRAVSKWETGLAMPDTSIMLELCEILQITADELLNGELDTQDKTAQKMHTVPPTKQQNVLLGVLKSIPIFLGLLALLLSFFTDGAVGRIYELYFFDTYGFGCRRLISFFFGGGEFFTPLGGKMATLDALSAISLFGVIAFVSLIVAVVLFVIHLSAKKEKLYVASCIFLILSGISILFLLTVGTPLNGNGWGGWSFAEGFEYFRLGTGTIVWFILCTLGGAFGLFQHFALRRIIKA